MSKPTLLAFNSAPSAPPGCSLAARCGIGRPVAPAEYAQPLAALCGEGELLPGSHEGWL